MLNISNISYSIAGRKIFDNASLSIPYGHKVGFIGPNGSGKSTLIKLLSGELEVDQGEISLIPGINIGMVKQDLPADDTLLIDVVLEADTERTKLLHQAEIETDPQKIADIHMRLSDINAYEAPSKASIILSGLGFSLEEQNSELRNFSGGWRMRVALAAALFMQPKLLLLDEPTNHLDFEAIIWLENYLNSYPHSFIIISHDRETLNNTVNHIVHLDQLGLHLYGGNYDQFEKAYALKKMGQQALFDKQQAHKKHLLSFINRFKAKASKAKQAQSRIKALEKMDMVDAIIQERSIKFNFPKPESISSPIITIDKVDIGYEADKPVLRNINLSITNDDRIALLGANGNGKSTLIKLIYGQLKAQKGNVFHNSKLRIGYFAQHQSDELDLEKTPYELLRSFIADLPEHKIRAVLGSFGFDKAKADTKIMKLSGGEKARLLFCLMSYDAPHIMLLDEPTNHLDIDARSALINALNNYEGCVIIVSHDPHLVESVADRLMIVKDQKVEQFDDDLFTYRKLVMDQRKNEKQKNKKNNKRKANNNKIISQLKKYEDEIAKLEKIISKIENDMTLNENINDPKKMTQLSIEYEKVKAKLEEAEKSWLELSANLDE